MKKDINKKILNIEDLRKSSADMTVEEIKERRKLKKQQKKKKGAFKATVFLIVVAILVLMLTPIFTIEWFEVSGNTKVSDNQILQISELEMGDNLFRFNVKKTKDKIRTISYIDEIKILRWFPSGVKIEVTERIPVASLVTKSGYLNVDKKGVIIEGVKKTTLPVIENIKTTTLKVGNTLKEKETAQIDRLKEVTEIIKQFDISERLTEFGIDKYGNFKFVIDGNKNVVLGEEVRLDYKLKMLKSVVDELSPTEEGTIDLSKEGQALYSPNKDVNK